MKKSGRVQNIIVDDVDECSDAFARLLCKNQISYVHVDNEFHCLDKVLRFYDRKNVYELNCGLQDASIIDSISVMTAKKIEDLDDLFLSSESYSCEEVNREPKAKRIVYTKRMFKQSSKMINDKIRNNRCINKFGR